MPSFIQAAHSINGIDNILPINYCTGEVTVRFLKAVQKEVTSIIFGRTYNASWLQAYNFTSQPYRTYQDDALGNILEEMKDNTTIVPMYQTREFYDKLRKS